MYSAARFGISRRGRIAGLPVGVFLRASSHARRNRDAPGGDAWQPYPAAPARLPAPAVLLMTSRRPGPVFGNAPGSLGPCRSTARGSARRDDDDAGGPACNGETPASPRLGTFGTEGPTWSTCEKWDGCVYRPARSRPRRRSERSSSGTWSDALEVLTREREEPHRRTRHDGGRPLSRKQECNLAERVAGAESLGPPRHPRSGHRPLPVR